MKCDEIRALLNPYVDEELSGAEAKQVKRHIGECPACAKEVMGLNKVKGMLCKLPGRPAPDALLEMVENALARPANEKQQTANLFWRYRWLAGSLASAAAVIVMVFTVMIHSRKNEIQNQTPVGLLTGRDDEKTTANFTVSVMPKAEILDAIQAQPMLFTQQINISAKNVDNAVAQVYALASTQTPDLKLRAEYQKKQAAQEEFLAKASNEQPIQDENPTASNSVAPMRGQKSQQQKQLGQTVKISIPLSQKDAFIKQLKGGINIADKLVLSEMQAISRDKLTEAYLANAEKNIAETGGRQKGNEPSDQGTRSYDATGKGGGKGADSKQAEANKIEGGGSGAAKADEATDKSAPQPKPAPKATTAMPPPPPPAAPAPSAPSTKFGKSLAEEEKEVNQDKDMKKQGDADVISQTSRIPPSAAPKPEPMIEFIIVIEPAEK